jgi:hypothetical protein
VSGGKNPTLTRTEKNDMSTQNLKARRGPNFLNITSDENGVTGIEGNAGNGIVTDKPGTDTFQENLVLLGRGIAAEQISTDAGYARHMNKAGGGALRKFAPNGRHFTRYDVAAE